MAKAEHYGDSSIQNLPHKKCLFCNQETDTLIHRFFSCKISTFLWHLSIVFMLSYYPRNNINLKWFYNSTEFKLRSKELKILIFTLTIEFIHKLYCEMIVEKKPNVFVRKSILLSKDFSTDPVYRI